MIRKDEGGLFMEVALVIGMFVCTALALNFWLMEDGNYQGLLR